MFIIIIPTYAQINSVKLILKLLHHVSVLIHQLQEFYKLCVSFIVYTCKLPEDGVVTPKHVGVILILI